jgi:hypothetical protein
MNRESSLPPEIAQDKSLMQYAVKGSKEQWEKVLEGKSLDGPATVQIQTVREKRKLDDEDVEKEMVQEEKMYQKSKKGKKSHKNKGTSKQGRRKTK